MAEKLRLEVWLPKAIKKDIELLSRTGLPVRGQDLYDRALRVHKVQWLTYRKTHYDLIKKGEVFEVKLNIFSLEKPKRIYVRPPLKREKESKVASATEGKSGRGAHTYSVKYIDLTSGKTKGPEKFTEREIHDLYKRQREGKVSIVFIHKEVASATNPNAKKPTFDDPHLGACAYTSFYITNELYGGWAAHCEHGRIDVDYADPEKVVALADDAGMNVSLAGGAWKEIGRKGYGEKVDPMQGLRLLGELKRKRGFSV